MVSNVDFESSDPSLNLGGTCQEDVFISYISQSVLMAIIRIILFK